MDFMFRWKVTDEIELQLLEPRHAEALFALTEANRQYLRQRLPWLDSTRSVADTAKFIASAVVSTSTLPRLGAQPEFVPVIVSTCLIQSTEVGKALMSPRLTWPLEATLVLPTA